MIFVSSLDSAWLEANIWAQRYVKLCVKNSLLYSHFLCDEQVLYVPPPDFESRLEVLHVHTRHMQLSDDVDLEEVAESTECFTGAELAGLCREAAIAALRESLEADTVCKRHFSSARNGIQPTLTPLQIASYANFRRKRLTWLQKNLCWSFSSRIQQTVIRLYLSGLHEIKNAAQNHLPCTEEESSDLSFSSLICSSSFKVLLFFFTQEPPLSLLGLWFETWWCSLDASHWIIIFCKFFCTCEFLGL